MGAVRKLDVGYINPHETHRPETDLQVLCQHPAHCECAESRTEKPARPAGGGGLASLRTGALGGV